MAKAPDGIMGGFSGNVGTVCGRKYRGQNVMSSKRTTNKKKKGIKAQLAARTAQQKNLALISSFLAKFSESIEIGFQSSRPTSSAMNRAMKYNMEHAWTDSEEGKCLSLPDLVLSDGKRESAWADQLVFEEGKKVVVSWELPETVDRKIIGNDVLHLIFYFVEPNLDFHYCGKTVRSDLNDVRVFRGEIAGSTVHGWMFFVSPDGKETTESEYLGSGILKE
jgi:Family of unknown function (DUF6266)